MATMQLMENVFPAILDSILYLSAALKESLKLQTSTARPGTVLSALNAQKVRSSCPMESASPQILYARPMTLLMVIVLPVMTRLPFKEENV